MSAVPTNILPLPDTLDDLVQRYIDAKRAAYGQEWGVDEAVTRLAAALFVD